jgi:imidazolonepropionase-like amidohydrolase
MRIRNVFIGHAEVLRSARSSRIRNCFRVAALRIIFFALSLPSFGIGCSSVSDPSVQTGSLVLTNGTLIDGTGAAPVPDAVVVIEDGRVTAVGPAGEVSVPGWLRTVNVNRATILPGFINAHVHEAFDRENLQAWAQAGITTVRDLCGPSNFSFRDQVNTDPLCARLVAAGPMVSVPNGYPLVPWGSRNMLAITSADDARYKVAQLLMSGADIIKIAVESGQSFNMPIPTLSLEEASAIVETAHQHGTVVSAHVLVSKDLRQAVEAGADDIAHMVVDNLPDSLIDAMVQKGTYWVPTIELWKNVGQGLGEAAISNLRRFVAAGGKVVLGTDYAGYDAPFQLGMPIHEIEWMQEAGMTQMEIIVAATKHAAHACNRDQDLGTLETGKIADILVVEGDPLQDLHVLEEVRLVLRSGVVVWSDVHHGAAK